MTSSNVLMQFNHAATALNLSGRQMQLWMSLYELITTRRKQDVMLYTPMLLDKVHLGKRQFLRVRQALIDAGFLAIRYVEQQRICYTLLLNGAEIAVGMVDEENEDVANDGEKTSRSLDYARDDKMMSFQPEQTCNICGSSGTSTPTIFRNNKPSSKLNRQDYCEAIEDFCQSYDKSPLLQHSLLQWADMRLQNGWQLTTWGLERLLENLREIAEDSVENMIATVQKSIRRRWKGFFSYTPDSRPNGDKLRKLEEKEKRDNARRERIHSGVSQKFKAEGRDLSYLVQ